MDFLMGKNPGIGTDPANFHQFWNHLHSMVNSSNLVIICDPSYKKGPYGKVLTLISLRSPRTLTKVKTFRYWQIFCLLSENSTKVNCHFEINEPYRPVFASFLFLLFYLGVPIRSLFARCISCKEDQLSGRHVQIVPVPLRRGMIIMFLD